MTFARPRLDDPRLKLGATVTALQVIGQAGLQFDLSIAQWAVAMASGALADLLLAAGLRRRIELPASGMLTGNSVALLLRVPGTSHGDWWTLRGWFLFGVAAAGGVILKYLLRAGGRHLFNPSNVGLVVVFLAAGSASAAPQFLVWQGDYVWELAAYAVILAGGAWVLWQVRSFDLAALYLLPFAGAMAFAAGVGSCFWALWSRVEVCGTDFWNATSVSPEILVFGILMISDPRTVPSRLGNRVAFALVAALGGAFLVMTQVAEFGVKVAILTGLLAATPLGALLDSWRPPRAWFTRSRTGAAWRGGAAYMAAAAIVAWAVAALLALPDDARSTDRDRPPSPGCSASSAQAGRCR